MRTLNLFLVYLIIYVGSKTSRNTNYSIICIRILPRKPFKRISLAYPFNDIVWTTMKIVEVKIKSFMITFVCTCNDRYCFYRSWSLTCFSLSLNFWPPCGFGIINSILTFRRHRMIIFICIYILLRFLMFFIKEILNNFFYKVYFCAKSYKTTLKTYLKGTPGKAKGQGINVIVLDLKTNKFNRYVSIAEAARALNTYPKTIWRRV